MTNTPSLVPVDEILPAGWVESNLLPRLSDLDAETLLDLDVQLTRIARAREDADDKDEWRRAVAVVRRRIGETIEPMKTGPKNSLAGANELDPATRTKRSEYRTVAEPPIESFIEWTRKEPQWKALVTRSRQWKREHTPAKPDPEVVDASSERIRLWHGDFRERLTALEAGSVDLIVTDPPYPKDDLPLWSDLGEMSAKLLGPRGILFAWTGQIFLPEVIDRLAEHLTYGWTYALQLPGSGSRIMGRHIIQAWKPVLAFTTGTWPSGEWGDDWLISPERDKTDYEWQQSAAPALRLIERHSAPDGLIVDPFLGVGSFGKAAKDAGRRFVGVELDAKRFQKAVEVLS